MSYFVSVRFQFAVSGVYFDEYRVVFHFKIPPVDDATFISVFRDG
jgi:hypothetical protein